MQMQDSVALNLTLSSLARLRIEGARATAYNNWTKNSLWKQEGGNMKGIQEVNHRTAAYLWLVGNMGMIISG